LIAISFCKGEMEPG